MSNPKFLLRLAKEKIQPRKQFYIRIPRKDIKLVEISSSRMSPPLHLFHLSALLPCRRDNPIYVQAPSWDTLREDSHVVVFIRRLADDSNDDGGVYDIDTSGKAHRYRQSTF